MLGPVLSRNASVALEALLARGCLEPTRSVKLVLAGMLERAHPRGFFYEPYQEAEAEVHAGGAQERRFIAVTATYAKHTFHS